MLGNVFEKNESVVSVATDDDDAVSLAEQCWQQIDRENTILSTKPNAASQETLELPSLFPSAGREQSERRPSTMNRDLREMLQQEQVEEMSREIIRRGNSLQFNMAIAALTEAGKDIYQLIEAINRQLSRHHMSIEVGRLRTGGAEVRLVQHNGELRPNYSILATIPGPHPEHHLPPGVR